MTKNFVTLCGALWKIILTAFTQKIRHTFHSRKTGGWHQYFIEEHKKLPRHVAGDLLVRLGYESSNDW
jgi:hypothetical protein